MPTRIMPALHVQRKLPIPVVLELLHLIQRETSDDVVLAGVVRTVGQAIDELTALRQCALEVMDDEDFSERAAIGCPVDRRRLC